MNIEWTQIIIALIVGAGGVGLWQAVISNRRLDSKERLSVQNQWAKINDVLQKERAATNLERASDRQMWQAELAKLEISLKKTQAELALVTSAYKEIRSALHVTEGKLREAELKIEKLRRKVIALGGSPDTGPLD
jgi:septal ring factor EnvC (AmiA/AmiB activator)